MKTTSNNLPPTAHCTDVAIRQVQEHGGKTILISFAIQIRYLLLAVIDNARPLKYLERALARPQG